MRITLAMVSLEESFSTWNGIRKHEIWFFQVLGNENKPTTLP